MAHSNAILENEDRWFLKENCGYLTYFGLDPVEGLQPFLHSDMYSSERQLVV